MTHDQAISHLASLAKRRRLIPPKAKCSVCGHTAELNRLPDGDIRCYSHRANDVGLIELDHFAGRATLPRTVIALDGNGHRRVTEIRRLAGVGDYPAALGDPILILAHLLAGIASLLVLFAEWLVAYTAFIQGQLAGTPPRFPVQP